MKIGLSRRWRHSANAWKRTHKTSSSSAQSTKSTVQIRWDEKVDARSPRGSPGKGLDFYDPGKWSRIREKVAQVTCKICNRLFGEHSQKEFDDHFAQLAAPTVRLYPKGRRAKKEDVWFSKCEICSRRFGAHTQQEYDACINQHMKRHKRKQEELVYVKCEIGGSLFGDHSPEKFDVCIDQLIENSF